MYDQDIVSSEEEVNPFWAVFAARFALCAVCVLIVIKALAYYYSGSVGLLGSLIDSLGDAVMSLVMLGAIMYAAKPADDDHRYGHGKAEGLAALFQSAILTGAACFLGLESLQRLAEPQNIDAPFIGIAAATVAILFSVAVVAVQNYALKRTRSLALTADQSHYKSDVILNSGVILGLLIYAFDGPVWIDSLAGIAIALYIGWIASSVGKKASDMLMDKELPDDIRLEITQIVLSHKGVYGMHDLRTRSTGAYIHMSFDVEVDPDITLRAAHEITRDLEYALLEKFPNADIIIHKDPKGDIYDARHKVQGVHH